jgi:hypothetical protein
VHVEYETESFPFHNGILDLVEPSLDLQILFGCRESWAEIPSNQARCGGIIKASASHPRNGLLHRLATHGREVLSEHACVDVMAFLYLVFFTGRRRPFVPIC